MKVFEITSGFIAAVVIALGVYSYVNDTKVEEEPVVKNQVANIQATEWFVYDAGSPSNETQATTPENYRPLASDDLSELCEGSDVICAVNVPAQPAPNQNLPDFTDMAAQNTVAEIEKHFDEQNQDPINTNLIRLKLE